MSKERKDLDKEKENLFANEELDNFFEENPQDDQDNICESSEVEILRKENESLKKELQEEKEKVLRIAAELDNFRKRLTKETEEKLRYANQKVILDFLPIIDNLEMAISHIDSTKENFIDALKKGVELTLKQFRDTLEKYGTKEIEANIGDEFNPNMHDAMMLDSDKNYGNNIITMVMQKGYTLNDRVIRPTKVRVNKIENENIDEKEESYE
jgi:molecular chaperone GrpE